MSYGTQLGSVPSTTERQTWLPDPSSMTSMARLMRAVEKSLR